MKPKWRVRIASTRYYTVLVDNAIDYHEAVQKAFCEVDEFPTYYQTCESMSLAGIEIDDKDSKFYYPYVHDGQTGMDDLNL